MHVLMERIYTERLEQVSTQVYFWNDQTKKGKFVGISSDSVIVDRQLQEEMESQMDQL